MTRDYTLKIYTRLIHTILDKGYKTLSYEDYVTHNFSNEKVYVLRHDVDYKPYNAVNTALIESAAGAKGTYYFRIIKETNVPDAIEKIARLGHEIGYHYEDLSLCNGNYEKSYEQFLENLAYFRKYYPVTTICMHGSPLSKWDNRLIWDKFSYRDSQVIAEPYFDTDFNKVLYITDTSRHWNASDISVRDKVDGLKATIRSTEHLIEQLKTGKLPDHIMQNIHPHRWTDDYLGWSKELIFQNLKNVVKRIIVSR
jgi:hypothetical protein